MLSIYNQPIDTTFKKEVLYRRDSNQAGVFKGSPYPCKRRERGACESRLGKKS